MGHKATIDGLVTSW